MVSSGSFIRAMTAALMCAASTCASPANADGSITDLSPPNGFDAFPNFVAISGDGTLVVTDKYIWTASAGSFTSLATLSGGPRAVSGNGTVAVGSFPMNGSYYLTSWNVTTGAATPIGQLQEGNDTIGLAVSTDGTTIVGYGVNLSGKEHAVRWENDTFQDLGSLDGGSRNSYAYGVSGDGSVVVGYSYTQNAAHAFRWTNSGGMEDLGTLVGGTTSQAWAVSRDGQVIVGSSSSPAGTYAVKWTSGGIVNLGVLSGAQTITSSANGVNADGSIIIGNSFDSTNHSRGFRWTEAGGMITVDQWLRNNGVSVPTDITSTAKAVSDDGNNIVGILTNGHVYLARLTSNGGGLIDIPAFTSGIVEAGRVQAQVAGNANLVIHGMHGAPVRNLPAAGQRTAWTSGDFGRATHGSEDADLVSGEAGLAYGLGKGIVAKFAAGRSYERETFTNDGSSTARGTFVLPELLANLPQTPLWMSVSGYANFGDADVNRGYLNAGLLNVSRGETDTRSLAFRARVDAVDAATLAGVSLTPYASITRIFSKSGAYTEESGAFPVKWDARSEVTTESRVGLDAATPLFERANLLARAEWVHRFDGTGGAISGEILGLNGFHLDGVDYKQDWARFGLGAEINVGEGLVSFMLNATTEGEAPSAWLYSGYSVAF